MVHIFWFVGLYAKLHACTCVCIFSYTCMYITYSCIHKYNRTLSSFLLPSLSGKVSKIHTHKRWSSSPTSWCMQVMDLIAGWPTGELVPLTLSRDSTIAAVSFDGKRAVAARFGENLSQVAQRSNTRVPYSCSNGKPLSATYFACWETI
jgi:hypothetical protein